MAAIIIGGAFTIAFFAVCIMIGSYAKNRNQDRSSGNPRPIRKPKTSVFQTDKKVPWTGYRFLGDDDSGRKKR